MNPLPARHLSNGGALVRVIGRKRPKCVICKREFIRDSPNQRTCSTECRTKYKAQYHQERKAKYQQSRTAAKKEARAAEVTGPRGVLHITDPRERRRMAELNRLIEIFDPEPRVQYDGTGCIVQKKSGKFQAHAGIGQKANYIGSFVTRREAELAIMEFRVKHPAKRKRAA